MKVLKTQEYKYFLKPQDVEQIENALTFRKTKKWLAICMGFSYKTLWSKMTGDKGAYFDQLEIEKMEELLSIKLERK